MLEPGDLFIFDEDKPNYFCIALAIEKGTDHLESKGFIVLRYLDIQQQKLYTGLILKEEIKKWKVYNKKKKLLDNQTYNAIMRNIINNKTAK